jgi:shikimate dehydrogenase
MAEAGPQAFIIGHPISHSRSPLVHGHWLQAHGLAGSYRRIDVAPAELPSFLRGIAAAGFVGGNVTIPHKEATFDTVDRQDGAARTIGAVNTLWLEDGLLVGSNTDAYGFAANLDAGAPHWRSSSTAIVIGAGGASRAVIHALLEAGIAEIRLVNRTFERAAQLARQFGERVTPVEWDRAADAASGAALAVNTTSLGMHGKGELPIDVRALARDAVATDIVYAPLETPFLREARRHGLHTVDGLGMLLHQAVPGFERWFGVRPEVTAELRRLVVADLGEAA